MNGIPEGMKKSWVSPKKHKFINLRSLSIFTAKEHDSGFLCLLNKENVILHTDKASLSSVDQTQVDYQFTLERISNQKCEVASIKGVEHIFYICFLHCKID